MSKNSFSRSIGHGGSKPITGNSQAVNAENGLRPIAGYHAAKRPMAKGATGGEGAGEFGPKPHPRPKGANPASRPKEYGE